MKVLTATRETQGRRDNDFCWAVEGELVIFVTGECSAGFVDDDCGCRRALAGAASHRATTTVKVVERPDLDARAYRALVVDSLESQGFVNDELLTDRDVLEWVDDLMDDLIRVAETFPAGTILERRGDFLMARSLPRERTWS